MNSFGRLFRVSLYGESHGPEVGVLIDGSPAGLPLAPTDFRRDLERRNPVREGTTNRKERDAPLIRSGVLNGRTTGAPILIAFENADVRPRDYRNLSDIPRPGHADFTARRKYGGFNDARGGGHFSGRITVGLVAAGVIAKKILAPAEVRAEITEAGGTEDIDEAVGKALETGDSIGGLVECRVRNLPAGLGEPFFDSAESLISHLIFAVPGIKGIEFGTGFACGRMKGSECNDAIIDREGRTRTNHSGGINGGLTNGNDLVFRAAVKPPSSISKIQSSLNLRTNTIQEFSIKGRHDSCIALRMPVVIEAAAAVVLADFMLLDQIAPRVMR